MTESNGSSKFSPALGLEPCVLEPHVIFTALQLACVLFAMKDLKCGFEIPCQTIIWLRLCKKNI